MNDLNAFLIQGRLNEVIQFDIDNTHYSPGPPGTNDLKLIIGSILAAPNKSNISNPYPYRQAASDDLLIRDQLGAGCKMIQLFSEYSVHNSMIIDEIKILTRFPDAFKEIDCTSKILFPDFIESKLSDVKFERFFDKNFTSESVSALFHAQCFCPLSSNKFIELNIPRDVNLSIYLKIKEFF